MTINTKQSETTQTLELRTAWMLNDGKIGDVVQCRAIAQSLGIDAQHRVVAPRAPWVWFSPWGPVDPKDAPGAPGSALCEPFPDLIIASGRRAAPYARLVKKQSGYATRIVMLKDPRIGRAAFDLIWAPDHDEVSGENIFSTLTAPHGLRARLHVSRNNTDSPLRGAARPLLGVLLGGVTRNVSFDVSFARRLAQTIDKAGRDFQSVIIIPSRRTPRPILDFFSSFSFSAPVILSDEEDIPYVDLLAYADSLIVTGDSHNLVSEAVSTGASVYTIRPPGLPTKMHGFLDGLEVLNAVRPLADHARPFDVNSIDVTDEIAAEIRKRVFGQT